MSYRHGSLSLPASHCGANGYLPQAPPRRELTEEERIYVQSGGEDPRDAEEAMAAQQGPGGVAIPSFTQMCAPEACSGGTEETRLTAPHAP